MFVEDSALLNDSHTSCVSHFKSQNWQHSIWLKFDVNESIKLVCVQMFLMNSINLSVLASDNKFFFDPLIFQHICFRIIHRHFLFSRPCFRSFSILLCNWMQLHAFSHDDSVKLTHMHWIVFNLVLILMVYCYIIWIIELIQIIKWPCQWHFGVTTN